MVNCLIKWPGKTDFDQEAISGELKRVPLEKRFDKSKMPQFHAIFVIDRSGSMGAATLDASRRVMRNLPKDRVGDVFELGVIQFLRNR